MVARCLNKWKKHKSFQKWSFHYTPSRSVSLLTSVLNFQASITDQWRPRMSRYFCLLCNWLSTICWQQKDFDNSWYSGYKRLFTVKKSMTSCRRKERCQRPKISWFDFVFPFAFKNKHRFENLFFHSLWKVWVLCDFLNLRFFFRIIAMSRQS